MAGPYGFQYVNKTGLLTINSVVMTGRAWVMRDLMELWVPTGVRGQNSVVPGRGGSIGRRRRRDEARHSLPMYITGECDHSGTPNADYWVGLEENIAYLESNIVTADTTSVTYAASLVMPSGDTRTADIQVEGIKLGDHDQDWVAATLEIVIPGGRFE